MIGRRAIGGCAQFCAHPRGSFTCVLDLLSYRIAAWT